MVFKVYHDSQEPILQAFELVFRPLYIVDDFKRLPIAPVRIQF